MKNLFTFFGQKYKQKSSYLKMIVKNTVV